MSVDGMPWRIPWDFEANEMSIVVFKWSFSKAKCYFLLTSS